MRGVGPGRRERSGRRTRPAARLRAALIHQRPIRQHTYVTDRDQLRRSVVSRTTTVGAPFACKSQRVVRRGTRRLFVPNPDQFCGLTRLSSVGAGSQEAQWWLATVKRGSVVFLALPFRYRYKIG